MSKREAMRAALVIGTIAFLGMGLAGRADAATSSVREPLDVAFFVPCAANGAGEVVALTGTLHIVSQTTNDSAGGVHIGIHFQPQGPRGTGLTTGDNYRGTGVTREHININAGGLPYTSTFINDLRIIGQGPASNFSLHETIHITINENGEMTASVDNFSFDCE